MIIIGEKINGSIPSVAKAIAERDAEFIKNRARMQAEANASFIDCCASVPEDVEVETLKWMIDCIQEVTDLPISIDSPALMYWQKFTATARDRDFSILFPARVIRSIRSSLSWQRKRTKTGKLSHCSATTQVSRKPQMTV